MYNSCPRTLIYFDAIFSFVCLLQAIKKIVHETCVVIIPEDSSICKAAYCAFDIFQKVVFCLTLYTEEVNLQTFVMI